LPGNYQTLGMPTDGVGHSGASGSYWLFDKGAIVWTAQEGFHVMAGNTVGIGTLLSHPTAGAAWANGGNYLTLGMPTDGVGHSGASGSYWLFDKGALVWTQQEGYHAIAGTTAGVGTLLADTSAGQAWANGVQYQALVGQAWANGGNYQTLGMPTDGVGHSGASGSYWLFDKGALVWTAREGFHAVAGKTAGIGTLLADQSAGAAWANGVQYQALVGQAWANGGGYQALGMPTDGVGHSGASGSYWLFDKGAIVWTAQEGFHVMAGTTAGLGTLMSHPTAGAAWANGGNYQTLGMPTDGVGHSGAAASYWLFDKGALVWTQQEGFHAVAGNTAGLATLLADTSAGQAWANGAQYQAVVGQAWANGGGYQALGMPSDGVGHSGASGSYWLFDKGAIVWTAQEGFHVMAGNTAGIGALLAHPTAGAAWANGGNYQALGMPTDGVGHSGAAASYWLFDKGALVWTQQEGFHAIAGNTAGLATLLAHPTAGPAWANGGNYLTLGMPTDGVGHSGTSESYWLFDKGVLVWTQQDGFQAIAGAQGSDGVVVVLRQGRLWTFDGVHNAQDVQFPADAIAQGQGGQVVVLRDGRLWTFDGVHGAQDQGLTGDAAANRFLDLAGGQFTINGFTLKGDIAREWLGLAGSLGLPAGNAVDNGDGSFHQDFQKGVIYWSAGTGAHAILGNPFDPNTFWGRFAASGYERGLGLPLADQFTTADAGVAQHFQGGDSTTPRGPACGLSVGPSGRSTWNWAPRAVPWACRSAPTSSPRRTPAWRRTSRGAWCTRRLPRGPTPSSATPAIRTPSGAVSPPPASRVGSGCRPGRRPMTATAASTRTSKRASFTGQRPRGPTPSSATRPIRIPSGAVSPPPASRVGSGCRPGRRPMTATAASTRISRAA
jgi:hypothetical protein